MRGESGKGERGDGGRQRWRVRGREGEQGECGRGREGEGEKGESEKEDWEGRVRGRTERWRVRGEKD